MNPDSHTEMSGDHVSRTQPLAPQDSESVQADGQLQCHWEEGGLLHPGNCPVLLAVPVLWSPHSLGLFYLKVG